MQSWIFAMKQIPFLQSFSWGRVFIHVICNYMMTWLNLIKYMHTYLIYYFWLSRLPSKASLIENVSTILTYYTSLSSYHHPLNPIQDGILNKTLTFYNIGEPSNEDSKGGYWLSSSCKCYFLMMMIHDEFFLC